jgi:internalin A
MNYAVGFRGRDVAFIEGLPLKRLDIIGWTLADLDPVRSLGETLVSLRAFTSPEAIIELAALPKLEKLATDWNQVRDSIDAVSTVTDLYLDHYTERDLTPLGALEGMRRLSLKDYPSVRSLRGVDGWRDLEHLGIYLARLLTDITHLSALDAGRLTRLEIPSCSKVTDLEPLTGLTRIEHLDLGDCGEIASIAPLRGFDALSWLDLYGTTIIADGDLRPLLELPALRRLGLRNRRHYLPGVAEVQEHIAACWAESHDDPKQALRVCPNAWLNAMCGPRTGGSGYERRIVNPRR